MDHEVPTTGADGRDRDAGAGSDPGHLREQEVSIMKGHVSKDHVHLLISLPPQVMISRQIAGTAAEVASYPQMPPPKLLLQVWELCQKMMRRAAFQPLH